MCSISKSSRVKRKNQPLFSSTRFRFPGRVICCVGTVFSRLCVVEFAGDSRAEQL